MKFTKADPNEGMGFCLRGYIPVPYSKLVEVFGEPHSNGDGYKVDASWSILFEDGTLATIYNYKNGKNYNGKQGRATKYITDWHVGGFDNRAVELVEATLITFGD